MSHIVKGQVQVAYKSKELLLKALEGVGVVVENEKLFRVGAGYTFEKYPIVLIDQNNKEHRIGYKEKNGVWEQYQENYGSYGRWTQQASSKVQDRYIAFHYEQQLKEEGFSVTVKQHHDGTLELEAEEAVW
ncbi:hypothetical protein L7M13_003625 [Klebsiella pneumoniae]|nr:hypothetical protein [Klebsiella pneumoniae]